MTSDAWGPVQLGMPVGELKRALNNNGTNKASADENTRCYYISNGSESNSVHFMIIDQRVVRFDVDQQSSVKTDQMIGIGSNKDDVLNAYNDVSVSEHPYLGAAGEYLEVSLDNGHGLIFETYNNQVSSYRMGFHPAVDYIEGCS